MKTMEGQCKTVLAEGKGSIYAIDSLPGENVFWIEVTVGEEEYRIGFNIKKERISGFIDKCKNAWLSSPLMKLLEKHGIKEDGT